jgi:hypothetical protein
MRRATACFVLVGIAILATERPVRAATDGFWVSVAAGAAGASTPSDYQEWWFDTPHGPPPVAVTQLNGTNVQATTAGGSSFFNAGAVPVALHPTDGYAYLAGGNAPGDLSQALKRQMAGGRGLASTTPDATATAPPSGSNLLSINKSDPTANGSSTLTVGLTDPNGNSLGGGSVTVPDNGWWVIGLGPNPQDTTPPTPTPDPIPTPTPTPDPDPTPVPVPTPGPVATPEPATLLLAGIGGMGACGWQFIRRRRLG